MGRVVREVSDQKRSFKIKVSRIYLERERVEVHNKELDGDKAFQKRYR